MGTERHFKLGSFYRICDRTGFATRAENTKREWQGLFVSKRVFEARQPQDFVRGVPDIQTVPYARPRLPDLFPNASPDFEVLGNGYGLPKSFAVQNGQFQCYALGTQFNPEAPQAPITPVTLVTPVGAPSYYYLGF